MTELLDNQSITCFPKIHLEAFLDSFWLKTMLFSSQTTDFHMHKHLHFLSIALAALVLASQLFATTFADEVYVTNCSHEMESCWEKDTHKRDSLHCLQLSLKFQHVACHLPTQVRCVCGPSTEQWH